MVWIYFYLPEIKNRTLEEIDEMFEARLPGRKFRKYVFTGPHLGRDTQSSNAKGSEDEKNGVEVRETVR